MRSVLIRVTLGLSALAVVGPGMTGVATATAARARARARARVDCAPTRHARSAPHLLSPCAGAIVARGHSIVFRAADPSRFAAANPPFLNLATTRTIIDGHLALNRDANGIFGQMTAVPGRPQVFTYTANRQIYPSWWDNRRGTYWVQLEQVDPQVPSGIIYGPITTVRVG